MLVSVYQQCKVRISGEQEEEWEDAIMERGGGKRC